MSIITITERMEFFDSRAGIYRMCAGLKDEQYYKSHTREVRLFGLPIWKQVTNRAFAESPKESPSRE